MSDINNEFIKAVKAGDIKMIIGLLNRGANIHFKNDYALQWSIQFNMLETSRLLLDKGANVNANLEAEHITVSFLRYAICRGNLELVNMLLEYNVDVDAGDGIVLRLSIGCTHRNTLNKRTEIVAKLLEHGADVHCKNKVILINLEKRFDEVLADLLLPYCGAEDYCYFPDAYVKERVVVTKGARNI